MVAMPLPSSADDEVSEIIVTARKREESLQDVPVAIQAFQQAEIDKFAATSLHLIAELANNVEISERGSNGGGGSFNIRGMEASAGDAGIDASVAVNIDGVQSSRGWITHLGFYDLGSVEILKGPQALFYGKDSPAGVVATKSALPTDEFESSFTAGYETEAEEQIYEAMVSGPITETLSTTVS
jgi:outer membrane receptor protein involved in Fe transport